MKKSERNAIINKAKTMSNEELEKEYYDSVFDSLGSQTEDMYELGYDIIDIEEREQYEKYIRQKSALLGKLCEERGIRLWEE
ncbi:MAG: hypothetical protein IJO13_06995 [Lachnospiraceae bacterium]|nr:hypothetical protein [Lachnospiraceae bacterium]